MFSKATLIGVVGIEPRYRPAVEGKDSVIAFRIGCQVFTSSKEITEWYTIKAFGAVADYLHNNIHKDSNVFLEASIRNRRWTVEGKERQGVEFHAFTARVMPDTDVKPSLDVGINSDKERDLQQLPIPAAEQTDATPLPQPKAALKPLTAEEAKQVASRFRKTLETCKNEVERKKSAQELNRHSETDDVGSPESVSSETDSRVKAVKPSKANTVATLNALPITGNSITDSLLNARNSLNSVKCHAANLNGKPLTNNLIEQRNSHDSYDSSTNRPNGYPLVRGGWTNTH